MNKPDLHWSRDLLVLRYLDAVQLGDLETVAALWDEASRDADLERLLVGADGALYAESAAAIRPLGERDRENIASVRSDLSRAPRRSGWKSGMSLVGALAAACLVAYLAWVAIRSKPTDAEIPALEARRQDAPRVPNGPDRDGALAEATQFPGSAQMTAFTWPLEIKSPITVGMPIRPDLFN